MRFRESHWLRAGPPLAYRLYARNFAPLFLIAVITIPLQLLIGVIQQGSSSEGAQAAAGLLNIPYAIVGLIASG